MTIVFSGVLPNEFIAMTVDGAVTFDFEDGHREYTSGQKAFPVPGVGCVTTWGARDHNHIGRFLAERQSSLKDYSVNELADLVYNYLTADYKPRDLGVGEVGYHVAGFDANGNACLYHIFWGFDRPRPPEQIHPKYEKYVHTPRSGLIELLYNGRNELADVMVRTLIEEINRGHAVRFDLRAPLELACFGDFVVRFAAELTPEVGLPIDTYLISPRNKVEQIRNDKLCPIDRNEVLQKLIKLGFRHSA